MKAGFARIDMTPAPPFAMGGYSNRTGPAAGVHDPLYARALVLEDRTGARLGLIALDLVSVTAPLCEAVAARAGWAPERLLVAATHTHSGPAVPPLLGAEPPADWWAALPGRLAALLAEACGCLAPVELALGSADVAGIGANRHDPERPGPLAVQVLGLSRPGGDRLGAVIHYPCHPTVLGAENLLVSADFPGALLAALGPGWSLYLNGAAGEISTRFTRRAQDFGEVQRLGALLAGAAGRALAAATPLPLADDCLRAAARTVALPVKVLPGGAEAGARVASARRRLAELEQAGAPAAQLRLALTALQGARLEADLADRLPHLEQSITLTAWAIGDDLGLVSVPGELFFGPAEAVAAGGSFPTTWVVGYGGGYAGYFPDRRAYTEERYEALAATFAPGSGEALAAAAIQLLQSVNER